MNDMERYQRLPAVSLIAGKDKAQENYIKKVFATVLTDEECERLSAVIGYFREQGYSDEEIAEAYLLIVRDIRNEMLYFRMNGCQRYRYQTLAEIEKEVYFNDDYMKRRMMGLQVADYLWENHVRIRRFYHTILEKLRQERSAAVRFGGVTPGTGGYLEVGPGDGQYFAEAIRTGGFGRYVGADLSPMSCEMTERLLRHEGLMDDHVQILCGDFASFSADERFDAVCISEVLEHVERPLEMLRSIADITTENASVYVHIPINAPSVWHIYLFHDVEEVRQLIRDAGFYAADELVVAAGGYETEDAVRKKTTINYAARLKKA